MSRGERDERRTRKLLEETVEKRLDLLGVMAALTVSLSLSLPLKDCAGLCLLPKHSTVKSKQMNNDTKRLQEENWTQPEADQAVPNQCNG